MRGQKSGVAVADVADKAREDFPVRRGREPGGEGVEVFLRLMQIGIGNAACLVVKALGADGINDVPDVFVGKAKRAKKASRSAGASESA